MKCSILILASLAVGLVVAASPAQDPEPKPEAKKKAMTVGSLVPIDITLPDLDGKPTTLYVAPDLQEEDRVVVLAWWSLRDPRSRKAEQKLQKIAADFKDRGVYVYLVESNHDEMVAGIGDPIEKLRKFKKQSKLTLPILLDKENKLADDFGALCSNHVYVISAKRMIRYIGAIDNDPELKRKEGREDWLREAINLALEGKSPKEPLRRPKGRKLSRAPKKAPAAK